MLGAMLVVWTLGFISGYRVGTDVFGRKHRSEGLDMEEGHDGDFPPVGERSSRTPMRTITRKGQHNG